MTKVPINQFSTKVKARSTATEQGKYGRERRIAMFKHIQKWNRSGMMKEGVVQVSNTPFAAKKSR
jgi:hypothetical protein